MEIKLNEPDFVNSIIPAGWAYCFNDNCSFSDTCMRRISAKFKDDSVSKGMAVYPDACRDGKCKHYLRARAVDGAWGFGHLYDDVKKCNLSELRSEIMSLLGGRTSYYRYHRGEKKLTPEMQQRVADVFAAYGYANVTFDMHSEIIDFVNDQN